ncbi:MAG: hypothetical protein SchgKO_21450 [Schleiferiaceae bacterium]
MTFEKKVAQFFGLNNKNWMRHSNPWSVYTRYTVLPIGILSYWSRIWIGDYWYILLVLSILWMFLNPVFFKKPKSTKNWASRSVMGERVYINRDEVPIPDIHKTPLLNVLNGISGIGLVLAIWGAYELNIWMAILGLALTIIGKSWYLDRMVWLYEDMKDQNAEYKSWEY